MASSWNGIYGGDVDWGVVYAAELQRQQAATAAAAQAEQQRIAAANAAAQRAAQDAQTAASTPPAVAPPVAAPFDPAPFRGIVDAGFSQFTPEWYANQYQTVNSPYKSGVENQFKSASDYLTAGLAKKGLSDSSQGRGAFQQLDALRDQEFGKGQSAAEGWQNTLTSQVGAAKEGLYGSIGAGKDNASIGDRTKAETDKLFGAKAPASSLGDVFGSFIEPYAGQKAPGGPSDPNEMAFAKGGNLNLAGGAGGPEASAKVVAAPKKKKF